MHFDFWTFLYATAALSGGLWVLDVLMLRSRRVGPQGQETGEEAQSMPAWAEYARFTFIIVTTVIVLHALIAVVDFLALLALAAAVTGGVWLIDRMFFSARRRAAAGEAAQAPREPAVVELSRSFFPIILVVLVLRAFVIEPFRIPSGSMMPTLRDGDFILVNKYAYGIRLPVINRKIIDLGEPKRGDVVVFRFPNPKPGDPSVDYIKRIIGLPGDHVVYRDKMFYIDGKPLEYKYIERYVEPAASESLLVGKLKMEKLGEEPHFIINDDSAPAIRHGMDYIDVKVPPGYYFVAGDNRDHSNDSRYWGMVPDENLKGRAVMIWMHWGGWFKIGWDRIGTIIR